MPTLAKLLDCLKWPKAGAAGTPVRPRGEVVPVADPELAFGWQGYLYNATSLGASQALNTILATVTIPDDCFYVVDFTCNVMDFTGAAGTITGRGISFQILDANGIVAYRMDYRFYFGVVTAVGVAASPPIEVYNIRLHLLAGMIVRVILLDATGTLSAVSASINCRKLYEENL